MSAQFRRVFILGVASILIAIIWVWQPEFDENDIGTISGFIEWFGLLYGILLALLVVEVWGNFTTVEREIDKEADELFLLYRTALFLNDHELAVSIKE
jgi:hypothetical protein